MQLRARIFSAWCISLIATANAQVVLDRLRPLSGVPGSTASLFGSGFQGIVQVQVSGLNAAVTLNTSTQVNFTVPTNAAPGLVAIQVSGTWYTNPAAFTIERPIQGTFNPPAGVSRAGYRVMVGGEFVNVDAGTGQFDGAVAKDGVAVVWAFRNAIDPAFIALVHPNTNQPVVDVASTAEALVLLNPTVNARSFSRYTNFVGPLRALSEFTAMVTAINSASTTGRDYLDDANVETTWLNAIQALLSAVPSGPASLIRKRGFEQGTPNGTKLRYLDPPETAQQADQGAPGGRRLKATLDGPDNLHPDAFGVAFESAGRFSPFENPLDWFIGIYELDANQFTNGLNSVSELASNAVPRKLSGYAVNTATVQATLLSKYLDILDAAAGAVMDSFFARSVDLTVLKPNETTLPARRPGVYVTEAYSGNLYYGTELFSGPQESQSQLITDLNGRTTWAIALGGNVFVAALDIISGVSGILDFVKEMRAKTGTSNEGEESIYMEILKGVAEDVVKGLAVHENQMESKDVFYDLVKNAASSLIKNLAEKALDNAEAVGVDAIGAKVLKTVGKSYDILGKISSVLQGVERTAGLLGGRVLAVERAAIVVGNPFAPRITSFLPTSGRGGEVLTIQGANFSSNTNELNVSFRQFASTEDPTAYTKRMNLPIIAATPTSIAVRVPWTNFANEFLNLRAYVVVERGSTNFVGSSAPLNPPYREFRFLAPPTLSSVFPNPVHAGGILELRGLGFDNETAREYDVKIDGLSQGIGRSAGVDGTRMTFITPLTLSTGLHNITIAYRGKTNASVPFTVDLPGYVTPSGHDSGYTITVTQADLSDNMMDPQITILEAILIAKRARGIQQHMPCEFFAPNDPGWCPYQEREVDHTAGDGSGPVDTISFPGDVVFSGPLPALSDGDRYFFGYGSGTNIHPFTLDGSTAGAGVAGLVLDGTSSAHISGNLVIQNFNGHGVHLRNGAHDVFLAGVTVKNCGGNGIMVEGGATANEIRDASITNVAGHGIQFTGAGTERNKIASGAFPVLPYTVIANCGGNGMRLDGGASFNNIIPGTIRNCQSAGIYVGGASNNFFGRPTEELNRQYDIVYNAGPGVHIGPGAVANVFRYLNPIGNQGDGVLLQGPGCSNNVVDRVYAGVNLYEGGTSTTVINQGSGVRLTDGAQFNLIGARQSTLGQRGSISGNRDDGVLLEGTNTAFNTVNAQFIGVLDPFAGVSVLKFAGNGRSGIALRNGAHDNTIGDANSELANAIFACPDAGVELTGSFTDNNSVFGNQIGAFRNNWVLLEGNPNRSRHGVWIHGGPRNNTIGLPGARMTVPAFPGDTVGAPHQCWNAINSCTNGVLIENAGGSVGTDGLLVGANLIQANHIGELDSGGLAPSGEGAGIKLAAGAEGNVIGGPLPELGNRIRGWYRAGIWIDQNNLTSSSLRNRIENNFIEGPGLGISFRYTDYLVNTPSGGVGILLTSSSGHPVGESQLTRNTLYVNRLGVYLADSSSNAIRGCYITNCYNAGLVVRGGRGNRIGGDEPSLGNLIHAVGFQNEPAWAGLALSYTTNNQVRGNEVGYHDAFRGSMGMLLTNAAANEIGGPAIVNGNIVVSNYTNGIVISGLASAGNRFFNNRIGVDSKGKNNANRGDGVRFEAGAHDNFLGGSARVTRLVNNITHTGFMPFGNVIASNLQAGVRVVGASTVGNRILFNQITGNGNKGILHENGGNNLQPPPVFGAFNGKAFSGNVANLAVTPPGSTVQLFTDPGINDPEGDAFLGEGTVKSNGTWTVVPVGQTRHPIITATATHALDGSTSEFGVGVVNIFGFSIARTDSAAQGSIAAGAINAAVFRLSLKAINADVRVKSVAFDTVGTLPDPAAVTAARLYRDNDENGAVTGADSLLSGPVTFGADNGRITFANMNPVIEANSTQQWVVAYSLASSAQVGTAFQLILTNPQVVVAEYINPLALDATPDGDFAIQSANFTLGAGSGDNGDSDGDGLPDWWEMLYFGNLSRDGTGDFDQDGFSDFAEFLLGTDPTNPASLLRIIPPPLNSPAGVTMVWSAMPGKVYRLQYRNAVGNAGSWTDVAGDVTAISTTAQKLDASAANQPMRFYRVALVSSGDSDSDGLMDAWEQQYFSSLSRNGTGDFDNDGASDAFEFLAGTAPNDANSVLKILPPPVLAGSGVTVQWASVAGKTYRLQFKNSLSDAAWQNVAGDITASGAMSAKTDSTATGQLRRYYRVLLVP